MKTERRLKMERSGKYLTCISSLRYEGGDLQVCNFYMLNFSPWVNFFYSQPFKISRKKLKSMHPNVHAYTFWISRSRVSDSLMCCYLGVNRFFVCRLFCLFKWLWVSKYPIINRVSSVKEDLNIVSINYYLKHSIVSVRRYKD